MVGRNEPCPCGSGKKYKKCCLDKDKLSSNQGIGGNISNELQKEIEGMHFSNIEEVQSFADDWVKDRNQTSLDQFQGLSPEQVHKLIYYPFSSPELVTFPETVSSVSEAPIMILFAMLKDAIGEKGLKPTATGNLPRNFCREAALLYWGEEEYRIKTKYGQINKEDNFFDLHTLRVVAEIAGLVRKYKGRFILSRNCREILKRDGLEGIYPVIFRAYAETFNWGYRDALDEALFVQGAFLFTLYLLTKYGATERESSFYEDCFINAFPDALQEIRDVSYSTPEKEMRRCYTIRTLVRFAGFLGLARVVPVETDDFVTSSYRVSALPLLGESVEFKIFGNNGEVYGRNK